MSNIQIEYPSRGATYANDAYGVYEYDTYPESSVLAGQTRRIFLDGFDTLREARAAYPEATIVGCGYQEQWLSQLPDDDGGDRDSAFDY